MTAWLKRNFLHPVFITALLTAIFIYTREEPLTRTPYSSAIPKEQVTLLEGTICSNPVKTSKGCYYSMEVKLTNVSIRQENMSLKGLASGKVRVFVSSNDVEALYPMRLHSLSTTEGFLFESGARTRLGVRWSDKTNAFYAEEIHEVFFDKGFLGRLRKYRACLRLMFKRLMCAWGSAGALILSLLSGAREYTEESVSDAFRASGLSHILALSGMHLSFFSSLAGNFSTKLFGKKKSFLPRLAAIFAFVLFAGLSPSLLRALICSLIMLTAKKVFCRELSFFHVLCACFIIHTVIKPADSSSFAFMLSYLSLAGILVFSDIINILTVRFLPPKISASVSASCGAQIATAPVSASVFGAVSPVGIVSTVVVSPMINIFLTVSIIAIIFSLCIPFLSRPFGCIMNAGYQCIMFFVNAFAKVPSITFR